MKAKAIKSLEQMIAMDSSSGDPFEPHASDHGKAAIVKGNQLMKKMSGKV